MRKRSWLQWHRRDCMRMIGFSGRLLRMKWLTVSGVVALGMLAVVAIMALGPQSTIAAPAPAPATASCTSSPTFKPTVSVVNSDTSQFAGGQTITIQGYGYQSNAPLTLAITPAGVQTTTDTIQVTTGATGCFSTTYALPSAGGLVATSPYPITVKVYDAYATQQANLTLRSCQEGKGASVVVSACGPQTLVQDATNYQTVQPLEQDAEQQIASLRGIANDTTNVYFSRGEIRAQMYVDLMADINACGSHSATCTTNDQAIVNYYANLVKQERVEVAQLADNLYEASGTFCLIPGTTTSCGWTSWKSNPCFFLVPLGLGAQTGPNKNDSDQQAYENTVCNGPPSNPFNSYVSPSQPSFDDFTTWAAAAIFGSQVEGWATSLMALDPSYTTQAAALAQVQQEYLAAMDSFQEGEQYLTVKHAQIPSLSSTTSAEQDLQGAWTEGFGDAARDLMTDLVRTLASSLAEVVIEDLAVELPEFTNAEGPAVILIAGAATTAVGLFLTITDSQLGCSLQSALSAAQSDNLYNDVQGNTSYTYSGSSCPSGTVSMSANDADALVLGALMASTMPDFTNLSDQASVAGIGPAQLSDPVFVTRIAPIVTSNTINVRNWSNTNSVVSVVNGWFTVNGVYEPDLETEIDGRLYRSWIDGPNVDTYLAAYSLGEVKVQQIVNDGCPGFLTFGLPITQDGLCVVPYPYSVTNFQGTPRITGQSGVVYDIALGTMPSQGGEFGAQLPQVRQASGFSDQCAVLCNSQGIFLSTPATDGIYSTAYLLTDPEPSCFTSSPFGSSATPECFVTRTVEYQDVGTGQDTAAGLHYVWAADDSFTATNTGQVTGGVLNNDAPTSDDQAVLTSFDVPRGYAQVSVVDGVSNGQLNLTASDGTFTFTANSGFKANSGGPSCLQFPISGTSPVTCAPSAANACDTTSPVPLPASQGYQVCGGPTASAADSFIYKLCYTVADVVDGGSAPTVCSYARASITGIPQILDFPAPGPKTYGDPPFSNSATSNGPGPITYTTGSGSVGCSIDATGTVTITGAAEGSNFCILTVSQGGTGGYLPAPSVTIEFHIAPALLSVTASHADLTYGDAAPDASSYAITYSGFKLSDKQVDVVGSNAPSCATNYQQGNDVGSYAINCTIGTLTSPNYTFISGYNGSGGFGSTSGTALSSTAVQLGAFKVNPAVLTVTPPAPPTVQYSDPLPSLTPTVTGFVPGQTASILSTQPTCTPGPLTASFANAAGTVTTTTGVTAPAGRYTITCSGAALAPAYATDYTATYNTATLTVTQEDAAVDLTSSQAAVALPSTGSATDQLTATVSDSAANGYTGANAESGATATIGDVTKMDVEFDIYQAGSCLSGTPAYSPVVSVNATSTAGVGTASYSFTQSTPGAFCVVPRVVGSTAGSVNGFYTAPDGPVNGLAFYVPNGAFVTGGGWVPDSGSSNGHGNFGFEAHYNNNGPKGQFVYVWRGTYNGQAADFIIKSNAITSLSIAQLGPNSYQATLQGKCSYSIVSQATGKQLYGEGNDTFIATVTDGDNGLSQQTASLDNFALSTFESGNVQLHPIATTPLSRGDVVVHN